MNFQNAQLSNIFRILSEVGGFNVVLSPSVQGTTNVRLEGLPWNHAMELVLKNNSLEKQCFGNVIRIVPLDAHSLGRHRPADHRGVPHHPARQSHTRSVRPQAPAGPLGRLMLGIPGVVR